jgi:hypothetical protein
MNPAPLNIVCFRVVRAGLDEAASDELNRRAVRAIQQDGRAFVTGTVWNGRSAIRAAFDNWQTTLADVPGDYTPTSGSLIGSLERKGLSVQALAESKEIDLRASFSCWLSREFTPEDSGLRFRRILCFEPLVRGRPPELVGDIFRALTPILAETPDLKTVALPVVAAGDQGYSVAAMLVPLLEAALHWLENGLPLNCLKIVTHSDAQAAEALHVFSGKKAEYRVSVPRSGTPGLE